MPLWTYKSGADPGFDQGGPQIVTGLNCRWCAASCEQSKSFSVWGRANKVSPYWLGSRACLRAPEALGYFITKYAFSPFWGTFLYYFWNNKILIFLDKLPWQTFLYTGIQILDQMDMYLFLKNYFLFKYQSIMHKDHSAMFMINVHFIMYNLYEPMKIQWSDAWIHICIRQWQA